jgi:hypothetical protein
VLDRVMGRCPVVTHQGIQQRSRTSLPATIDTARGQSR